MNIRRILGLTAITSFFVFMVWAFSYAAMGNIWTSSHTATADTTLNLCKGNTYLIQTSTYTEGNRAILHGICINNGALGNTFTVYNSSGSANNPIALVSTSTPMPCSFYDVSTSSGLTYTNSSTADVTILYNCF
jgi:hypothetical protein